jgi:hypothetical protein
MFLLSHRSPIWTELGISFQIFLEAKRITLIENIIVDIFCSYSSSMTGRILPE